MELGKQVGPDDARRAEKEMEKINERAMGEAKKLVEGARRGLDGGRVRGDRWRRCICIMFCKMYCTVKSWFI